MGGWYEDDVLPGLVLAPAESKPVLLVSSPRRVKSSEVIYMLVAAGPSVREGGMEGGAAAWAAVGWYPSKDGSPGRRAHSRSENQSKKVVKSEVRVNKSSS